MPVAANVTGSQVVLVANNVEADVTLAVTIKDAGTQSVPVTIVVRPAPLFSGLTVLASGSDCGSSNLCSGATGTAAVTAKGIAGAPLPGRQIKFDVVYGPFAIQTTNPAAPLAQTLTVVTDANGIARVGIQSAVDATTQPAQVRATDLDGGQQITGNFTVVNNTTTSAITVIPAKATITAPTRTNAVRASKSTISFTAAIRPTVFHRPSRPARPSSGRRSTPAAAASVP